MMNSKTAIIASFATKMAMETQASAAYATGFCREIADAVDRLHTTPLTGDELRAATVPSPDRLVATNNRRINQFAKRLVAACAALPHLKGFAMNEVILTIRKLAGEPEWHEPNIEPMMSLSTTHLSPAARAWLDRQALRNIDAHNIGGLHTGGDVGTLGSTMHGWFMHAPAGGVEGHIPDSMPQELATICRYVRDHGCAYILFDADADEVEDLPTWEDSGDIRPAIRPWCVPSNPWKDAAAAVEAKKAEVPAAREAVWVEVQTPVDWQEPVDLTHLARSGGGEEIIRGVQSGPPISTEDALLAIMRNSPPGGRVIWPGAARGGQRVPVEDDAGLADELAEPGELDLPPVIQITTEFARHLIDSINDIAEAANRLKNAGRALDG